MNTAKSLIGSSFFVWVAGAILAFFYLFTFDGFSIKMRPDRIKFGIDLIGGTYITLRVETEKAIEAELQDKVQIITKKLQQEHIEAKGRVEKTKAFITFDDNQQAEKAQRIIAQDHELEISRENTVITFSLTNKVASEINGWAVDSNIKVLRTRLDALGVGEIGIVAQGDRNIIVELPNVSDPAKAKAMIGKPAILEIKLVEKVASSPDDILDEYDGQLPDDMIIVPGKEEGHGKSYYLVPAFTDLTGRYLKDASVGFNGIEPVVQFTFKPEGGEKFYDLTRKNPHRQIAIIIDGIVISAPKVNMPVGSEGIIQGNFTTESASELATLLKSGAFVVPVTFAEERQIGPSLGEESIQQGVRACLVGLALLFLFSVITYKVAGLFAFIALLFNLLIIMVILGALNATLTLPGIAGMVLTLGMAIDASILIYEKVREDVHAHVEFKKAINNGFSDAMEVILDSNITHFIVGVVLYKFGVGPIQGFALTLIIGIFATLLTGLFFLRSLFNFFLYNLNVKSIKI